MLYRLRTSSVLQDLVLFPTWQTWLLFFLHQNTVKSPLKGLLLKRSGYFHVKVTFLELWPSLKVSRWRGADGPKIQLVGICNEIIRFQRTNFCSKTNRIKSTQKYHTYRNVHIYHRLTFPYSPCHPKRFKNQIYVFAIMRMVSSKNFVKLERMRKNH